MPYIYSMAGKVYLEDYTMMRLLAFDFLEDLNVHDIKDQYMFGDSFMVCPVTDPMYYDSGSKKIEVSEKKRNVYLPAGVKWYDFWTNEMLEGNQNILTNASIDIMPLYVKGGSILTMSETCQNTSECDDSKIKLKVYPGKDGIITLYQDAGDSYDYEFGKFSLVKLYWNDVEKELTIGDRKGSYLGMPEIISFKIEIIGKDIKTVEYAGTNKVLRF